MYSVTTVLSPETYDDRQNNLPRIFRRDFIRHLPVNVALFYSLRLVE